MLARTNSSVPDFAVLSTSVPGKTLLIGLIAASIVATIEAWQNDRWQFAVAALGLLLAGKSGNRRGEI